MKNNTYHYNMARYERGSDRNRVIITMVDNLIKTDIYYGDRNNRDKERVLREKEERVKEREKYLLQIARLI